jgi:Inner membrane protein YgaP-like, transmembrane domain
MTLTETHTENPAMTIERAVLAFAGFMVLLSVALGYLVSPWWFLLTAFAGVNLLQSAFTGFCLPAIVLSRLGLQSGTTFSCIRKPAA